MERTDTKGALMTVEAFVKALRAGDIITERQVGGSGVLGTEQVTLSEDDDLGTLVDAAMTYGVFPTLYPVQECRAAIAEALAA